MRNALLQTFTEMVKVLDIHSGWIAWNLCLAFIPFALSIWLYRRSRRRSLVWWGAFAVFMAFLPNAPYLLTDIIHLIRATRAGFSTWVITLFVIPLHLTAIIGGFQAYVLAVMNQSRYLAQRGWRKWVLPSELGTHLLCAVGVYLGRFDRFNSWDLVVDPNTVLLDTANNLTSRWPLLMIAITFVVLTVTYWLVKQVTIGLNLRWQQWRAGFDWTEDVAWERAHTVTAVVERDRECGGATPSISLN